MSKDPRFVGDYGTVVDQEAEDLWYRKCSREAQNAYENGQKAFQQGFLRQACFWLGRAARLARKDPKAGFSYAMALLKAGYFERALAHLKSLRQKLDVREVIFTEVLALWGCGQRDKAGILLKEALSCYVPPAEIYPLIEELVACEQVAGWVELSNSGLLKFHTNQPVSISLDGRKLGVFETRMLELGSRFQEGLFPGWAGGRRLSLKSGGEHLLGSPLDLAALTSCASLVWPEADGIRGWLWYPAEPDFVPHIQIDEGEFQRVETAAEVSELNPLGQARAFFLPLGVLPGQGRETVKIKNDHGVLLTGSPLDPKLGRVIENRAPYPAHYRPVPIQARPRRNGIKRSSKTPCAIIIPVYADYAATMVCLKSVLETVPSSIDIIVVEDASPEKKLSGALDKLAAEKKITLLKNDETLGFPASVNKGLRYVQGSDVILLNSDTVVFEGWFQRLRAWLSLRDVGTATPFSNHATLMSYPSIKEENPFPNKREAREIDQYCQENGTITEIELPTANGFCMAISAECLAETGLFRDDIFVQGYGEENDFCLRATGRGFRHLAAVNVYVAHRGGRSFKKNSLPLIERNLKILNALHPGYDMLIAEFIYRDPLFLIRRRLDFLRMAKGIRRQNTVLLIEHNYGGGVARVVRERAETYEQRGMTALRLRPTPQGCKLELCRDPALWPNLRFSLPEENMLFLSCLRKAGVSFVEWHHLAGHAPWIRKLHNLLDVPVDIFVHDHIWFCPRVILLNEEGRYCGERGVEACRACIAGNSEDVAEKITIDDLLMRSQKEFQEARSVTTPSYDAAKRLARHFPHHDKITIEALEDETLFPLPRLHGRVRNGPFRIGVVGAISRWKGYDILLTLGRYIQQTDFPLEIVLVGSTEDDETLLEAGIQVMGPYDDRDVLSLIEVLELDLGFIPSIAPETWCYALSWLWKAGLEVISFDIGAVSERICRRGVKYGAVLPLGLPVDRLAATILGYCEARKKRL